MENRKHPRFKTRFDALCSSGNREGAGVLTNLSRTGAQLEETSYRPELGSDIRLYVFVQPVSPFELIGRVVRLTHNGFAVELDAVTPDVERLVGDVKAMVSS